MILGTSSSHLFSGAGLTLQPRYGPGIRKRNAPCKIIMTMILFPSLKFVVPKMLQNNAVYKISCPRCDSSYVIKTVRHLKHIFKEHVGTKGPLRTHFETLAPSLQLKTIYPLLVGSVGVKVACLLLRPC